MVLQDKIIILDNVLSAKECFDLIKYYNEKGPTHNWRDTYPLSLDTTDSFIMFYIDKIESSIKKLLNNTIMFDWGEIVKWPTNSFQTAHKDNITHITTLTSVTYLNIDYQGGHTFFKDDFEIKPKIGRTIYFDGIHYMHGVTKVTDGIRYTLPIWYKKNGNHK